MNIRWLPLAVLVVQSAGAPGVSAQPPADPDIVEIPTLGVVDLRQLPRDLRDNIRIPGVEL
jgi:hypothetical protein